MKQIVTKLSLFVLFSMLSISGAMAQWSGGQGDGYAEAEASFTITTVDESSSSATGKAFPNPARAGETVTIVIPGTATTSDYFLTTATGQRVVLKEKLTVQSGRIRLATHQLTPGIYFLHSNDHQVQTVVRIAVLNR